MNNPTDREPECNTCGKTTCPGAEVPDFERSIGCAYLPIYDELVHDRCEYGCARDVTQATIRHDIVPTVECIIATRLAEVTAERDEVVAQVTAERDALMARVNRVRNVLDGNRRGMTNQSWLWAQVLAALAPDAARERES